MSRAGPRLRPTTGNGPRSATGGARLVAHGAGSSPAFVQQAFGGSGPVLSWWLTGHGHRPARPTGADGADLADLDRLAKATGARVVGGVSYGAHLAARWAASLPGGGAGRLDGLVLVMPAWTGPAGGAEPAAATARTADTIERLGLPATLALAVTGAVPWVAAAIEAAWPAHDPADLVTALRAIASSAGPSPAELGRITVPVTIVVNRKDPFHPAAVAADWAALLPRARVVPVTPLRPADLGAASVSRPDRRTQGR